MLWSCLNLVLREAHAFPEPDAGRYRNESGLVRPVQSALTPEYCRLGASSSFFPKPYRAPQSGVRRLFSAYQKFEEGEDAPLGSRVDQTSLRFTEFSLEGGESILFGIEIFARPTDAHSSLHLRELPSSRIHVSRSFSPDTAYLLSYFKLSYFKHVEQATVS